MKTHRIYLKEAPGIWRDLGVDYTRPEAIATARQYRRDWPKRVYAVRKIHKIANQVDSAIGRATICRSKYQ